MELRCLIPSIQGIFDLPWPVRTLDESSLLPAPGMERLGGQSGLYSVLRDAKQYGRGPKYYLQMYLKLLIAQKVKTQFYLVLDAGKSRGNVPGVSGPTRMFSPLLYSRLTRRADAAPARVHRHPPARARQGGLPGGAQRVQAQMASYRPVERSTEGIRLPLGFSDWI